MSASAVSPAIRALRDTDCAAWDAYVEQAPGATFFHRARWARVIERAFGHRTHYLLAELDGRVCGVLPLVHVKSRLFSNGLISGAFGVYGGPVGDSEQIREALTQRALSLLKECGADFIEYRSIEPTQPGWSVKDDLYVTFRRPIAEVADDNLKAIPRKQRAVIRKAIKANDLKPVIDEDSSRLHAVYAESVRNLGTPVFSSRYFQLLHDEFGDDAEVLTMEDADGAPISSVLSFYFRDQVLPFYGGGVAAGRRMGANDFMYWCVMERARERGYRMFDFGRSKKGTGSFAFKKHWGFEPEPLSYEFYTRPGGEIPDVNPLNPKYAMFIAIWQKLPLPVANLMGPLISRNLG